MVVAESDIQRVAIVDDNPYDADAMGELVREAGFQPIVLDPPFHLVSDLLNRVCDRADAAICDHRLRGQASFSGAEAVAALVDSKVPAMLVTQYIDIDADVSIRRWRQSVPILLSRDDADPDSISLGLGLCAREIRGEYVPGRRAWRTLIQVDGVNEESGESVVDVRIPAWKPYKVVRFPMELVPEDMRHAVVPDGFLFAMVNIGAEKAEDLYFRDFEAAPEPVHEESLG